MGAEVHQCFDQHRRLDGHVQRAGDARALEGLLLGVLGTQGHQARHFMLGQLDLLAAKVRQLDVLDLVVKSGGLLRLRLRSHRFP